MAEFEREYEYKPKWWAILLTLGYFALGAAVCIYVTMTDVPAVVRWFYWALVGLCLVVISLVGVRVVERTSLRRRVALSPTSLLLPKSLWSSKELAIDYGAITDLFVSPGDYAPWTSRVPIDFRATDGSLGGRVKRARFLYVIYSGQRRRITAAEFPSHVAFEEFCTLVTERVRDSRLRAEAGRTPTVEGDYS